MSAWFEYPLDRLAALVIVVAVAKTGWNLLCDAMQVLLDASLDVETLDPICNVINTEAAVVEVKWLTGRNAGRFRFLEAGVALRVAELDRAEAAMRRIETNVRAAVPHVDRVLLHVEAMASPYVRYAVPLASVDGTVSRHFVTQKIDVVLSREDVSRKGPAYVLREAGGRAARNTQSNGW